MQQERVWIPSTNGTRFPLDVYVPDTWLRIDPHVKRPAIIICPGGGYRMCSERAAEPAALRFLTEGFNVYVLWYRVNNRGCENSPIDHDAADWYSAAPDHVFPMPQQDAAAAVAWVRRHAQEQHTDPDRITILGYSAGAHLAGSLAGLWPRADLWQPLGLSPEDVRPNAAVLCYPVIVADKDAHRGSFERISGSDNPADHEALSVLNWVGSHYPPTFLWQTFTDPAVPVQNSIRMAHALADAGVLCELHVFPYGGHGLGLSNDRSCPPGAEMPAECAQWPQMCARFLRSLGRR